MQLVQISSLFNTYAGAPSGRHSSAEANSSPLDAEMATIGISNFKKDGSWALDHVHMKPPSRGKDADRFRIEKYDILLPTIGSLLRDENSPLAFLVDESFLNNFEASESIGVDRYVLLLRLNDLHSTEADELRRDVCTLVKHFINLPATRSFMQETCCRGSIQPILSKKEFLNLKIPNFFKLNPESLQNLLGLFETRKRVHALAQSVESKIDDFIESITAQ